MTSSWDRLSDHHTFSQRYGYEPLPESMRLEEISKNLRREIFNAIRGLFSATETASIGGYMSIHREFVEDGARFVERIFGKWFGITEDKIGKVYDVVIGWTSDIMWSTEFYKILNLLEILANDKNDNYESSLFPDCIKELFEQHGAAYRLDTSQRPYRFFPIVSEEQGDATRKAIEALREDNMDGATTHLRQAAEHINAQQYADSIVDSIHAVESVARVIDPKSNKTLGPALKSLEDVGLVNHPALTAAFSKLYRYTNDEQGLRHALTDQSAADVGLDEAMFMFGACASFAAYLTSKHRQSGQGPNSQ